MVIWLAGALLAVDNNELFCLKWLLRSTLPTDIPVLTPHVVVLLNMIRTVFFRCV